MMHGSQGRAAFGKIFFVRHFREPIPLQTTAMDQVTTVMESDASAVEVCENAGHGMPCPYLPAKVCGHRMGGAAASLVVGASLYPAARSRRGWRRQR